MKIRIRAKRDGFRRCGVSHSKEWTEYMADKFTPEQLHILEDEPNLEVKIEGDDEASPEAKLEPEARLEPEAKPGKKPKPGKEAKGK